MKNPSRCPASVELTREYYERRDTEGVPDHVKDCSSCQAQWQSMKRLSGLSDMLETPETDEWRKAKVREQVLREAAKQGGEKKKLVPLLAAAAAAVVLLAGGVWFLTSGPASDENNEGALRNRGFVHGHGDAQFFLAERQPDEIIRLTEGTITVKVDPLKAGERFRVVVGDAQVEVKGTVFDVTAKDDQLLSVSVISGRVVVRPNRRSRHVLSDGEVWSTHSEKDKHQGLDKESLATADGEVDTGDEKVDSVVGSGKDSSEGGRSFESMPKAEKRKSQVATKQKVEESDPSSPAEKAFSRGWSALRGGEHQKAVESFTQALGAPGSQAVEEDARFWKAVATARMGLAKKAAGELEKFLELHPASSRAKEASVMLGWQMLERGNAARAKELFEAGVDDPSSRVRRSAKEGLAQLGAQ